MSTQTKLTSRLFVSLNNTAAKICPNRCKNYVLSLFWLSGLLNVNGPYRGRLLLGDAEEGRGYKGGDEEDDKHDAQEAVMVHCSACIEEHFVEHLSPTLHKGSLCDEARDLSSFHFHCSSPSIVDL